jgi:hypothetical protein
MKHSLGWKLLVISLLLLLSGCSVRFTGIFSNIQFKNGYISGVEIFVFEGPNEQYFALVQCSDGRLGLPALVKATRDSYTLLLPPIYEKDSKCPQEIFKGEIGSNSLKGSFAGSAKLELERRNSVWQ